VPLRAGRSGSFHRSKAPMQMSNYDNVILYDGVCGFCNTWVDLVLRIDKNGAED